MQQAGNFTGWDFTNVWTIYTGLTNPLLRTFMAPLTVTANAASEVYDAQPFSGGNGVSYSTTPNGNLLGTVNYTGNSQGAVNVGSYVITPSGPYSSQQGYLITYADAALAITAAPVTVTADALSRIYGAANPALTYSSAGLIGGDSLSGGLATTAGASSNVGNYAIAQGTVTASSNYALIYVGADLTVTAAPLTVAADAQSRLYGAANPALSYVATGLLNGDALSGNLATAASATSNVGDYGITQGTLGNSNYDISYAGANLSVTAASLAVTADAQSRVFGASNPALTYIATGLLNGDNLAGGLATSASATSNVGDYGITQGTLANSNYAISYAGANLSVTAASLTVTADAQSRVYGASNPAFSYNATGLLNGDSLSGSLATTASGTSNVGAYGITQGTVANANYAISYVGADLTVTAAALTVTADSQSRTYGAGNPALSYVVTGLVNGDGLSGNLATAANATSDVGNVAVTLGTLASSPNYTLSYVGADLTITAAPLSVGADAQSRAYGSANPTLTYTSSGLLNGDSLSGALATAAASRSDVGRYAITQGSIANPNYIISYTAADLGITAAELAVTANTQSRGYGAPNPALTYTSIGLLNGDALSGALDTSATAASPPGQYGISQGTLAGSINYIMRYAGAVLTVTATPAPDAQPPGSSPDTSVVPGILGSGVLTVQPVVAVSFLSTAAFPSYLISDALDGVDLGSVTLPETLVCVLNDAPEDTKVGSIWGNGSDCSNFGAIRWQAP
jgi:hypothetical protein